MRICGAQRILGRAAVHGAIELGRHTLQDQLLPLTLSAAIQQAATHPRPGEEGFRENLILLPPSTQWDGEEKGRRGG